MQHNIEQARNYLRLLTGSADTPVTFQTYYDPKDGTKHPDLAKHFVGVLDANVPFFEMMQQQQCGIYVGINQSDGTGRKVENIVKIRALFADFDGMAEPQWALPPHFITRRDATHGHAYWLIDDVLSTEAFTALQKRIQLFHGTDEQVTDASRVARLPGFNHLKNPNDPKQYYVDVDNTQALGPTHRYTTENVVDTFELDAPTEAILNGWLASRAGTSEGTGFENSERYENEFASWCENVAPIAIQGSGTLTVFKVAGYAYDRGIPLETTKELMWNHYNQRCVPAWREDERNHFSEVIEHTYKHATSAPGNKTAKAAFQAEGDIPPPIEGWEENAKKAPDVLITTDVNAALNHIERGVRLDNAQASVFLPQLTVKSGHYDLARAYDGIRNNGCNLIRAGKIFYQYDGVQWAAISDEEIQLDIFAFYSDFRPPNALVKGIFDTSINLTGRKAVSRCCWLSDPHKDTSNLIVYQNGILNLDNDTRQLIPHTPDFFTFNSLKYDYDESAQCPNWLKFLDSIWQNDEMLKLQLQEWMGYCLSNDTSLQKFAILMGKSRGGKGVIGDIIRHMVGIENTVAPTLSNLVKDSTLYSMSTSKLVLIPDAHSVNFGTRDAVLSNFKAITGGDPIDYHVLYKGTQTDTFNCHIMLSTNNMPEFVDSSGALANRMLIFPFHVSFAGKEDKDLKPRLLKEISGISNWALAGLERLNKNGKFTEAESGLEEKEDIREDMFPLSDYVTSMCELDHRAQVDVKHLYAAYTLWATLKGVIKPYTEIQFAKILKVADLPIKYTRKRMVTGDKPKRVFEGLKLNADMTAKINMVNPIFEPIT